MVRNYVRKTDRASIPELRVLRAVRRVVLSKDPLSQVPLEMNIPRRTLKRYCSKASQLPGTILEMLTSIESLGGYKGNHTVLSYLYM